MDFPATQWSLLAQASLHGDTQAQHAMGEFYSQYRGPVVAFLRRRGLAASDVEDLAQGFFLHLMEGATLRRVDAARGRFRSFLLGALMRFLAQERERQEALKRGGGARVLSLDVLLEDGGGPLVPPEDEMTYDREWAVALLCRAVRSLEAEYQSKGRAAELALLRLYLPGSTSAPPPYQEMADRAGLSLGAFKTEVFRVRMRLRDALRREIASTVSSPELIDAEVAYLGRVLQARTE